MKNKKMLWIISIIVVLALLLQNQSVQAASMGLSISKNAAYIGDTFTVTISGINGRVTISGNTNISLNISGSQWVDGSLTITGTAKTAGTGKITVVPVDVTTTGAEPEEVTASASRSITITKKEEPKPTPTPTPTPNDTNKNTGTPNKTNNNKTTTKIEEPKTQTPVTTTNTEDNFYISMLKLIGVKENQEKVEIPLSPLFDSHIYTYTCEIEAEIQKIEVEKEAGAYIDAIVITGTEELKEGENLITIQLAAEDHEAKIYTIRVVKKEQVQETGTQIAEESNHLEENKQIAMITMPVWSFILMQIGIIVIEVLIIYFVPWKKLLKRRK